MHPGRSPCACRRTSPHLPTPPRVSVQVWFQNRRQRAKATVVAQMYASGCVGQKRSAEEEAGEEAGEEAEEAAVARGGVARGGAASRGAARGGGGGAAKGGATSAMDSLAMISSLAAEHAAEHAVGRGGRSAPSA